MISEVEHTLLEGVQALEKLGLRYAIVGGLAVSAWAIPRATRDVDIYADLPQPMQPSLKGELEARGFHGPAMTEEFGGNDVSERLQRALRRASERAPRR